MRAVPRRPVVAGVAAAVRPGSSHAALLSQGDKNNDQKLSREELAALADTWFDKLDPDKTGKIAQADFSSRFARR